MEFEQKVNQIVGAAEAGDANMPDDSKVLTPEPFLFTLDHSMTGEKREYVIRPLCIAQMRLLTNLSKLKVESFEENDFDKMVECISRLIGEKDKDFIENSITGPKLQELFGIVTALNYAGIPATKGGQSGKQRGVRV